MLLGVVPTDIDDRPGSSPKTTVVNLRAPRVPVGTSNFDTAKGLAIVTECCGPSLVLRPFSVAGDPIAKLPAGTTTILGQSFAHSLKESSACSWAPLST